MPEKKPGKETNTGLKILGSGFIALALTSSMYLDKPHDKEDKIKDNAPCDFEISLATDIDERAAARRCLEDRVGRIALVGFGDVSEQKLKQTARETHDILRKGTGGLIDVEVVPVKATNEANRILEGRNPFKSDNEPCSDPMTLMNTAGYIADETMDLDIYDHVIGIDKRKGCENVGGVSSPEYSKRHGSTYNGYGFYTAGLAAHEIAHTYDLNHGDAVTSFGTGLDNFSLGPSVKVLHNDPGGLIDLTSKFRSFTKDNYNDYGGSSDLMGQNYGDLYAKSTDVWKLQWPERSKKSVPDMQRVINGSCLTVEWPSADIHDFAALMFDQPLKLEISKDAKGNSGYKTYDRLILDPLNGDDNIVHVYLLENGPGDTLSLGFVKLGHSEDDESKTIIVNDQAVELKYSGDGIVFSDVSGRIAQNQAGPLTGAIK